MSDTILTGKLTVYYLDENRRKQITWTGTTAKTDVQKQIDIYDATEDLMTLPAQQNKGLIYSAETPGEYTIGKIDAGDIDPWFIDLKTMEHVIGDFANFTGCAVKTSGWTRVEGTNTGIIVVPVTSGGAIVIGDVGFDIVMDTDSDVGTLLDVIVTGGGTDYLWIRPDSNAAANSFDNSPTAGDTLTCNAHQSTQSAASLTGEMVWGNFYTQGALLSDTHVYVFQGGTKITISDDTDNDWWPDGQVDRAIPITDYQTDAFPTLDLGFLTVKANQYGSKHTYSIIRMNTTTGGNVAAGLSSGADAGNTTGYASITFTASAGNWTVGDEMTGDNSNARGIITQIDNPGSTQTVHYYLVGDPLTDFDTAIETLSNADDTGTGTKNGSATALQGPALTTWFDGNAFPTYAFASTQVDISGDAVDEEYGITIDLNQATLAQMHEYNKYTARRGSTLDYDGLDGEEWIGLDLAVTYSAFTTTIAEGDVATQQNTLATAVVVSFPGGTNDVMLLRNTRGTFNDSDQIDFTSGGNISGGQITTVEVIVPVQESSLGTLAGTSFFFTRGVVPIDFKSAEENLFSCIDATGVTRTRPTTITMTISSLLQDDWASCFRLLGDGLAIDKVEYSATGGETVGGTTLTVDGSIANDVPGNSVGGRLIIQDVDDNNQEYVIRFDSFVRSTGVVTLSTVVIVSADAATTTTIQETAAFANSQVGDLVVNSGNGHDGESYIKTVTDDDNIIIDPPITGQTTGDNIDINSIPNITVNTADNIYFSIIFEFQTGAGSASAGMEYISDIFTRVVVRNTTDATIKIKGFTAAVTIGNAGATQPATRTENTVYGS